MLGPTGSEMEPDAVPLVTAVPFTVMVACESELVGVTVTEATPLATLSAYVSVPEANDGIRVPEEIVRLLKLASELTTAATLENSEVLFAGHEGRMMPSLPRKHLRVFCQPELAGVDSRPVVSVMVISTYAPVVLPLSVTVQRPPGHGVSAPGGAGSGTPLAVVPMSCVPSSTMFVAALSSF